MPCITQHLANHTQIFKKSLPLKHNKPSQRNNPFKDKYLPKCEYLPECEYLPKCKYIPRYSHLSKYSSFSKFSTCVTPSIFLPRKISGAVFSGFTLCIFSLAQDWDFEQECVYQRVHVLLTGSIGTWAK